MFEVAFHDVLGVDVGFSLSKHVFYQYVVRFGLASGCEGGGPSDFPRSGFGCDF